MTAPAKHTPGDPLETGRQKCVHCERKSLPGFVKGQGLCRRHWEALAFGGVKMVDAIRATSSTGPEAPPDLAARVVALEHDCANYLAAGAEVEKDNTALSARVAQLEEALGKVLECYRIAMLLHGRDGELFEKSGEVVAARAALARTRDGGK